MSPRGFRADAARDAGLPVWVTALVRAHLRSRHELRLRHRRRQLGRLRALANRLSANPRTACCCSRPAGAIGIVHPHAGRPRQMSSTTGASTGATRPGEPNLDGRRLWWPRQRCSAAPARQCDGLHAGRSSDYDEWAGATGDEHWAWRNVLPLFQREARRELARAARMNSHGGDGPRSRCRTCATTTCCRRPSSTQRHRPALRNEDFSGATQAGFGLYQVTQKNGARCSSAVAYLRPARSQANLTVLTGATRRRVRLDDARAVGVDYRHRGRIEACADRSRHPVRRLINRRSS